MREGTITPNCTNIAQQSSRRAAPENIDLKDNFFTTYLEEDPSETPIHELIIDPGNTNKVLTLSKYEPNIQEIMASKGESSSEIHEHPDFKGV